MSKNNERVTKWLNPFAQTAGKYGNVTNQEWLTREMWRVSSLEKQCEIKIAKDGTMALFVAAEG